MCQTIQPSSQRGHKHNINIHSSLNEVCSTERFADTNMFWKESWHVHTYGGEIVVPCTMPFGEAIRACPQPTLIWVSCPGTFCHRGDKFEMLTICVPNTICHFGVTNRVERFTRT